MNYEYLKVIPRRPRPVKLYVWLSRALAKIESITAVVDEQIDNRNPDIYTDVQLRALAAALHAAANRIEGAIEQRAEQRRAANVRQLRP